MSNHISKRKERKDQSPSSADNETKGISVSAEVISAIKGGQLWKLLYQNSAAFCGATT